MQNIYEITSQSTYKKMLDKITSYYSTLLHIDIVTQLIDQGSYQQLATQDEQDWKTELAINLAKMGGSAEFLQYQLQDTVKIGPNAIPIKDRTCPLILDRDQFQSILQLHFNMLLTAETPETLKDIQDYIYEFEHSLLAQNFDISDKEETMLKDFLKALDISATQVLYKKRLNQLLTPTHHIATLLLIHLDEISDLIYFTVETLSLEDLLTLHKDIKNIMSKLDQRLDEDVITQLEASRQLVDEKIQQKITEFTKDAEPEQLHQLCPSLANQIKMKDYLSAAPSTIKSKFEPTLDNTIKTTISTLLDEYEGSVNKTHTDIYKSKKLTLIKQLKTLCTDIHASPQQLFDLIKSNAKILRTDPLGDYIYKCICWLFNIVVQPKPYQVKLFTEVNLAASLKNEDELDLAPKHSPRNNHGSD